MGTGDLSDSIRAGLDLKKALEEAKSSPPLNPSSDTSWRKLADEGLAILQQFSLLAAEAVPTSYLQQAQADGFGDAIGAAYRYYQEKTDLFVETIRAKKGCSKTATMISRVAKSNADRQIRAKKDAVLNGPERTSPLATIFRIDIPKAITCPPEYRCTFAGIEELKVSSDGDVSGIEVCKRPILITKRFKDIHGAGTSLELTWKTSDGWSKRIVPRENVMDAKNLLAIASDEAPVTSVNVAQVVKWLAAFEAHNETEIPTERVTSKMGWQDADFKIGFVLGERFIPYSKDAPKVDLVIPPGMDRDALGWGTKGTWEGWVEVVEAIREYPIPFLAIYSSVASVLLQVVNGKNACVDWSCETSLGKTTVLRLAASVWGNPDDRDGGLIKSWNSTNVSYERMAGLAGSLPMFMDDTAKSPDKKRIATVIYEHSQGAGRGRGAAQGGKQRTDYWWSMLLSTGENAITSFTEDGGTRARTLCVRKPPFGRAPKSSTKEEKIRRAVNRVNSNISLSYGHLGLRVVEWLKDPTHRDMVNKWCVEFLQVQLATTGGNVAGRLLEAVSVVYAAQRLCKILGVPEPVEDPVKTALNATLEGSLDSDVPRAALTSVYEWAIANQTSFYGRQDQRDGNDVQPVRGWLGHWPESTSWEAISFLPSALKAKLEDLGYHYDNAVTAWKDRGWLESHVVKREGKDEVAYRKNRRIGSMSIPCISIPRDVIDLVVLGGQNVDLNGYDAREHVAGPTPDVYDD